MRTNTRKAITAFLLGAKFQKLGDSISTDGRTLFSYRTPIAKRTDDGTLDEIQVNPTKYSHTTTLQQSALRLILTHDLPQTKIVSQL